MLPEERIPLSQSALWRYQHRFYVNQGMAAWQHACVPYYITCNPFIAESYARIVAGYVQDWRPHLDPRQPLYLVELGAGSGRFAYLFLRAWQAQVEAASLHDVSVTYVMTDLAERNVTFWQAHPALEPFLQSGLLDVATLDLVREQSIHLVRSGKTLAAGQVANPMIVVANYLFDSLPQDLFLVREGKLYAGLTTLSSQVDADLPEEDEPFWHDQLDVDFVAAEKPVAKQHYGEPVLDETLASYAERFADHTGSCAFTFPIGAYHSWRTFSQMAGARVLLLSADKGYQEVAAFAQQQGPGLAFHGGGFSLDVNYHALDQIVQKLGGHVLHGGAAPARVVSAAYLGQEPPNRGQATRRAGLETFGLFGPDDFYALVKGIEPRFPLLSISQVLALLRLSRQDPRILYDCLDALQANVQGISPVQRAEILAQIALVWDNYYHIGEEQDLAYGVGTLCMNLGAWREAIFYMEQSNRLYGDNAHVCYELAECWLELGQNDEAISYLDRVLAQMPGHLQASALRKQVAA